MDKAAIEIIEAKIARQDERIGKIEMSQAVTNSELKGIHGKLDRLIMMDEKLEVRFQEKEACKMVREHVKDDINGIGKIAGKAVSDLETHLKYHWNKADKYVTWITGLLMSVFVIGKIAGAF